ncbi:MAG: hypothetical protein V4671_19355 [Armatimonadota bacterium]
MSRGIQKTLPTLGKMEPRKSRQNGLPPAARREDREFTEQCNLFMFLRTYEHVHPVFGLIGASGNGIFKTPPQAARAKMAGMRRGDWDIMVPAVRQFGPLTSGALFVEMKAGRGKLTPEQEATRAALQGQYTFVVARDWIEAARAIVGYLGIKDPRLDDYLKVNTKGLPTG